MIELEFFLTNGVGGAVVHTVSEPVFIALDYQSAAGEFDAAISQLTTPAEASVPIPGIVQLVVAGLLGIIGSTIGGRHRLARRRIAERL